MDNTFLPTDKRLAQLKACCQNSFGSFAQLFQGSDWFDTIHEELCDFIQYHIENAIYEGKTDCKILVIMGRGTLKTTFCTKLLPVWLTLPKPNPPWDRIVCPNLRTLVVTNTFTNAKAKLSDIRSIFDHEEAFQLLFKEVLPRKTKRTGKKDDWTTEKLVINRPKHFPDATFTPASTGTRLTGTHFTCIIEDDTTAPDESDLQVDILTPGIDTIEKAIGWHKQATMLMVPPKDFRLRLVVSTRWTEFDLVNYILHEEKGWAVFDRPTEKEDGSPMFPKLHTKDSLSEIKEQVGPYIFSSLYQNKPLDQSMKVFRDEWIHYIEPHEVPEEGYYSVAIDPAISEKDSACETAITRVKHVMKNGKHPYQYWDRAIHKRLGVDDQVKLTVDLLEEDLEHTKALIIETVAYQEALRHSIETELIRRGIRMPIIPFKSRSSKDVRIQGLVPFFSANRIFLVKGISTGVEKQLRQYPFGRLVDVVDSFAMHYKALKSERPERNTANKKIVDPLSWDAVEKEVTKKVKSLETEDSLLFSNFDPFSGFDGTLTRNNLEKAAERNPLETVVTNL